MRKRIIISVSDSIPEIKYTLQDLHDHNIDFMFSQAKPTFKMDGGKLKSEYVYYLKNRKVLACSTCKKKKVIYLIKNLRETDKYNYAEVYYCICKGCAAAEEI